MGHRVVEARARTGLTAAQIQLHRPELSRLETVTSLTTEDLELAAKAYRVSLCWISGHDGQVLDDEMMTALDQSSASDTDRLRVIDVAASWGHCGECSS